MLNKINISAFILLICISISACSNSSEINPFSSDGCSLFPDSSVITKKDWCECCYQHDVAYWQGGTKQQRKHADFELKKCVLQKTGDQAMANLIYEGVRVGGSPYFYNWYRWGYGWSYLRNDRGKYQALTEDELQQVKRLTEQYLTRNQSNYCKTKNSY